MPADTAPIAIFEGGVIPYINVNGAAAASEFYQRAFGAIELERMPGEDGRLLHCRLTINSGLLMMTDCFPERGPEFAFQPSTSHTLHLLVDDIDAWWRRAIDAGCTITMPLEKMFWGDRYGRLTDPFGIHWALNQPADQPAEQAPG